MECDDLGVGQWLLGLDVVRGTPFLKLFFRQNPPVQRGLDVGAIEYIRKRIIEERDKGRAILLVSFELDEIMNLCDRIAAISKGSIAGIFNAGEVTEREIGIMMAGSKKNDQTDDKEGAAK